MFCSGSLPLPADLFSGLEHLTVESTTSSQTDPFSAQPASISSPSKTFPAASSGPALSGPSLPAHSQSKPVSHDQLTPARSQEGALPQQLMPTSASVPAPAAAPEARRKKKTSRRVGYARDQPGDASAERTASDTPALPDVSPIPASINTIMVGDNHAAQSVLSSPTPAAPSTAATEPSAAVPATSPAIASAATVVTAAVPAASAAASAAASKAATKAFVNAAPGSPLQSLQSQPARPKSPVKAAASESPKKHHHHHKAASATVAAPAIAQLASLSLSESVAAASLAVPAASAMPFGYGAHILPPAALTPEALLQVNALWLSMLSALCHATSHLRLYLGMLLQAAKSALSCQHECILMS